VLLENREIDIDMRKLLLSIFLLVVSFSIYCQNSTVSKYFRISFGPGFFFDDNTYNRPTDSQGGISLYCSANWLKDKIVETADGSRHRNNKLKIRFINYFETIHESKILHHYDLGLLYGKSFGRLFQINISGGIGIQGITEEVAIYSQNAAPRWKYIKYVNPGIPLELGISFVPSKGFGLGLAGFSNLNKKRSLTGIVCKIEFGKRR
jgi:hypothetical protein